MEKCLIDNKVCAEGNKKCKDCTIWIVTNLAKQKVYCPYRIKNRCMLGGKRNEKVD